MKAILAIDDVGGLGKDGNLPWRIREDLKRFKSITTSGKGKNAVLMGRKTWESLPHAFKPLPGRLNIIASQNASEAMRQTDNPNVVWISSFEEAFTLGHLFDGELFVIGGVSVFEWCFKQKELSMIYLTQVQGDFSCDVKVKSIPKHQVIKETKPLSENEVSYQFLDLKITH